MQEKVPDVELFSVKATEALYNVVQEHLIGGITASMLLFMCKMEYGVCWSFGR